MRPNILFLLIDGLRADQCFGKDKTSYTPNIDSLIQKGTYFSNAFTSVDGTGLSLRAISHSLYPTKFESKTKLTLQKNNLFDILIKNGYEIDGLFPDLKGFSDYVNYFENKNKTYAYWEYADSTDSSKIDQFYKNTSSPTTNKIIDFLKFHKSKKPWFYYFHAMTLHPLKEYFASHKIKYVVTNSGIGDFDDEKYGAGIYERVVSFIDNELGKILEYVDFDNTILILLADHGQKVPYEDTSEVDFQPKLDHAVDFGKKILPKSAHKAGGEFLYNIRKFVGKRKLNKANEKLTNYQKRSRETFDNVSLFDEMLHIPLLFVNNNINPGIISNTVNHTDILPTLCGILNINLNHKVNGRNLLPLIQGNSIKENPIYLRTRPYIDSKLDKRDSVGIRTSNYKYFRSIHNPKDSVHLYDLKNDPYENNNIAETNKELVDKLEELLLEIQENDFSENNGENVEELTHDEIEYELKKMGYV